MPKITIDVDQYDWDLLNLVMYDAQEWCDRMPWVRAQTVIRDLRKSSYWKKLENKIYRSGVNIYDHFGYKDEDVDALDDNESDRLYGELVIKWAFENNLLVSAKIRQDEWDAGERPEDQAPGSTWV